MKSCLVDTNVWLALVYNHHSHHAVARQWFEGADLGECCFCRLTQLGFLRLLTNARVMGRDVRTESRAWEDYDAMIRDDRVSFVNETPKFEAAFRELTSGRRSSHRIWPDAYLGALAQSRDMRVISFDSIFRTMPGDYS